MTSGSKTANKVVTTLVRVPGCENSSILGSFDSGSRYSRNWSGGNSPTIKPRKEFVADFSYDVYDKHGKFLFRRKKVVYRRVPQERVRTLNAYSASISQGVFPIGVEQRLCPWKPPKWPGDYWITRPLQTYWQIGDYPSPVSRPADISALYGQLSSRLGAGFNLATFLGEGREALGTIAESSTRIYKALKALRKGRPMAAWNSLRGSSNRRLPKSARLKLRAGSKNAASNWLQLQYGWLPLLSDIKSACEHLAYTQNRDFTRTYRVRSGYETEGVLGKTYPGRNALRLQLIAKVTSINQLRLLGISDPRATAWELLPFSFVVDWFLPVGDYLDQLRLRGALTGTFVLTEYRTSESFGVYNYGPTAVLLKSYQWTDVRVSRTISSSMPRVQLPQLEPLDKAITVKRAVNAVSLILQMSL